MLFDSVILSSNLQCPPTTGRFFCVKDCHVLIVVFLSWFFLPICTLKYMTLPRIFFRCNHDLKVLLLKEVWNDYVCTEASRTGQSEEETRKSLKLVWMLGMLFGVCACGHVISKLYVFSTRKNGLIKSIFHALHDAIKINAGEPVGHFFFLLFLFLLFLEFRICAQPANFLVHLVRLFHAQKMTYQLCWLSAYVFFNT